MHHDLVVQNLVMYVIGFMSSNNIHSSGATATSAPINSGKCGCTNCSGYPLVTPFSFTLPCCVLLDICGRIWEKG